jgi:MoaA/NifB/PqqE/SkfB family radical SAM enzyme
MTFEYAASAVKYFAEFHAIDRVVLLGGEPTLVSYFQALVSKIREWPWIRTVVITNGIDCSRLDNIPADFLDTVAISFEGISRATHEAIRGKGTFGRAIRTLHRLKDRGFSVEAVFTVTALNLHEARESIGFFADNGVYALNFHVVSETGDCRSHEKLVISPSQWLRCAREIREQAELTTMRIRLPQRWAPTAEYDRAVRAGHKCLMHDVDRIHLFPDGRAYNCCLFFDTSFNRFTFEGELHENKAPTEASFLVNFPSSSCVAAEVVGIGVADNYAPLCVHWKEKLGGSV